MNELKDILDEVALVKFEIYQKSLSSLENKLAKYSTEERELFFENKLTIDEWGKKLGKKSKKTILARLGQMYIDKVHKSKPFLKCSKCGESKSRIEFNKNNYTATGAQSWCSSCAKEWYELKKEL